LFIFGLFFIFLAEIPNLNVEIVSAILFGCGEHVTIKLVFEFPQYELTYHQLKHKLLFQVLLNYRLSF